MSGRHSAGHVAALVTQMPHGESKLYEAMEPDAGWTRGQILLALLVNCLNGLVWGMSDKKSRGPQPTPVGPSWMTKGKTRKLAARTMRADELMKVLSKPRKGRR